MNKGIVWRRDRTGEYTAYVGKRVIATAALTGRYGSDNYPWDWSMDMAVETPKGFRSGGAEESFRVCKDHVQQAWNLRLNFKEEK